MRKVFAILAALAALPASANAGCRLEGSYPGRVAGGKTVERTLFLSPNHAQINVVADSDSDRLVMLVRRPSGAAACGRRGPGNMLDCLVTVKRKGNHVVRISNPTRRAVTYSMQCWNAGD